MPLQTELTLVATSYESAQFENDTVSLWLEAEHFVDLGSPNVITVAIAAKEEE